MLRWFVCSCLPGALLDRSVSAPSGMKQLPTPAQVADFCPDNDCVIAQIQINKGVLTNPTTSPKEKLRALKFIVHFIGDLHQPLHTADDSDRGGNDKEIRFLKRKMKLH